MCRFLHIRNHVGEDIATKGGITIAYNIKDDGVDYALALCTDRDNYSRKIGRAIAGGRLKSGVMINLPMDHMPTNKEALQAILGAL